MQCVSDRFLRRSEQSDLQHSSVRVYTWINMWLSMTGQSSKSHFNATCKLSNKLITPGYCHVCVQLCVCVCLRCVTSVSTPLSCICVWVSEHLCVNLDSYQFEPESLCMTDCFVCLTTTEKRSISPFAFLSSLRLSLSLPLWLGVSICSVPP